MRPLRRFLGNRAAIVFLALWWSVGGSAPTASGQPASPAPTPVAPARDRLERVALAAARSELVDRVLRLPVDGDRTLADWLAGDVVRDRALRKWIRTTLPAESDFDAAGASHVTLTLSPVSIRDRLLVLASEPGQVADAGAAPRPIDWHAAAARWSDISVTAAATSDADIGEAPQGWENVTVADRALTRRAAEADARGELLRSAAGLRVTSARVLGDFFEYSDAVRAAVLQGIDQRASATTRFEPDQIAVAEARIALADLIDVLLDVHLKHYTGAFFRREHFREMSLIVRMNEIKATGFAAPPQSTLPTLPELPSSDPLPAASIPELPRSGDESATIDPRQPTGEPARSAVSAAETGPGVVAPAPPVSTTAAASDLPLAAANIPRDLATSRPAIDPAISEKAVDSMTSRPLNEPSDSRPAAERAPASTKATKGSMPTSVPVKATPAGAGPPSQKTPTAKPGGQVPPARTPTPPSRRESSIPGAPPWAGRTLLAVGRAAASSDEQQTRQAAAQAALRSLRDQILELEVENDLTVGAVLGYREELHAAFESAVAGARPAGNPVRRADGLMEVTVELPLLRIWRLLETESSDDRYATDRDLAPDEPPANPPTSRPSPARP